MHDRLLNAFQNTFQGQRYIHRNQGIGNFIASHLYEDLLSMGRSPKFVHRVSAGTDVVNAGNLITGRSGRRGDGTFGELVPGESPKPETGFVVQRGPIATLEIGTEVKILAKAMIKQIDRVMQDLKGQALTFRDQTEKAIRVGIVGVNFSEAYVSFEGDREYKASPPPAREAAKAIDRIEHNVRKHFDELLILKFRATNVEPYPFEWVAGNQLRQDYSAALLRISNMFEGNF